MSTSKLKMFSQLYTKDMRELVPEIVIVVAAAVILNGLFYFNMNRYTSFHPAVFIIPTLMVLAVAAFLPFISSFKLVSREWSNNTVYLIMSLPVSGVMIMGAKLAALITQYIAGTLIAVLMGLFLAREAIPDIMKLISNYPDILNLAILFYLLSIAALLFLISMGFLSQITGKLSSRFSSLITFIVFLLTFYCMSKIINFSIVKLKMITPADSLAILNNSSLTGELLILLLAATLVFTLAVVIYDRKIEL